MIGLGDADLLRQAHLHCLRREWREAAELGANVLARDPGNRAALDLLRRIEAEAAAATAARERKQRQRRWLLREGLYLLLTAGGLSWVVSETGRGPVAAGIRSGFDPETRVPVRTRFGMRMFPLFAALILPGFYVALLLVCVYWLWRGWRRASATNG